MIKLMIACRCQQYKNDVAEVCTFQNAVNGDGKIKKHGCVGTMVFVNAVFMYGEWGQG